MSTDVQQSELYAFYRFLGQWVDRAPREITPEKSVEAFRAYQHDLERLRNHLQPSLEQAAQGKTTPLDVESLMDRVLGRLAADREQ